MALATGTAFNGLLKKNVLDAGDKAVETYQVSVDPPAPRAVPAV